MYSYGGTLKSLVDEFRNYILTGNVYNSDNMRSTGGLYCDHWGYSQSDMQYLRNYAKNIGYPI